MVATNNMLELKDKVVTLETAKRLVELGIVMDTEHTYHKVVWARFNMYAAQTGGKAWKPIEGAEPFIELDFEVDPNGKDYQYLESYPAPDSAELGAMLPQHIYDKDRDVYYWISTDKTANDDVPLWEVSFSECNEERYTRQLFRKNTEAEARGRMLIWLKENNLL